MSPAEARARLQTFMAAVALMGCVTGGYDDLDALNARLRHAAIHQLPLNLSVAELALLGTVLHGTAEYLAEHPLPAHLQDQAAYLSDTEFAQARAYINTLINPRSTVLA